MADTVGHNEPKALKPVKPYQLGPELATVSPLALKVTIPGSFCQDLLVLSVNSHGIWIDVAIKLNWEGFVENVRGEKIFNLH